MAYVLYTVTTTVCMNLDPTQGYLETMFGRRRSFDFKHPDLLSLRGFKAEQWLLVQFVNNVSAWGVDGIE